MVQAGAVTRAKDASTVGRNLRFIAHLLVDVPGPHLTTGRATSLYPVGSTADARRASTAEMRGLLDTSEAGRKKRQISTLGRDSERMFAAGKVFTQCEWPFHQGSLRITGEMMTQPISAAHPHPRRRVRVL